MQEIFSAMKMAAMMEQHGRFWGRGVFSHGQRYLDRRCATFRLTVSGAEHLHAAAAGACLIVANHVIHRPENAILGRRTRRRPFQLLDQPPDSFIFRRIVREQTGLPLRVVAKSDRGAWSPRRMRRLIQQTVGQPFGKGFLEGMGYIPVEHNPGCKHRTFFDSATNAVSAGEPIMVFPGNIIWDTDHFRDTLLDGGVLPGASHLARKFGLPILPAYLQGGESWQAGHTASVCFGPVFRCEDLTKAEINRLIVERIQLLAPSSVMSGS